MTRTHDGIGAPAPPLDLPDADGRRHALDDLRGRPVVVSFLGPAHCAFCRAHVLRVVQAQRDFDRLDAQVVMVAYADPELLTAKMLRDLDLPFRLLLDPGMESYRRWGLGRESVWSRLQPGLYWAGFKIALRREPSMGTSPDPGQLGGDFVVDPHGRVAFANRMTSFYDRAKIPTLIAAIEGSRGK